MNLTCVCRQCRTSRKKRFGGSSNWLNRHEKYVLQWMNKELVEPTIGARSVVSEYREYLMYLHRSTRVHVRPPMSTIPIVEGGSDEEEPYDLITRRGV